MRARRRQSTPEQTQEIRREIEVGLQPSWIPADEGDICIGRCTPPIAHPLHQERRHMHDVS